jgi:hypothetical protein
MSGSCATMNSMLLLLNGIYSQEQYLSTMKLSLALTPLVPKQSYSITTIFYIFKLNFKHTTNFILTYIHDIEKETPQ